MAPQIVITAEPHRRAHPVQRWLGLVLAAVLAALSAVGGATELRLQTDVSAVALGETFEVSLWLDLSARTEPLGINAAGLTLSWDTSVVDLADGGLAGGQSSWRDFISTPTSSVALTHGADAYYLAGVHYDNAGIATFALGLLAARGDYSSEVSSSVVPCVDSSCERFDLVTLRLQAHSLVPAASVVVSLRYSAPQYAQSPGTLAGSSATVSLDLMTGSLSPDGEALDVHFASAWELGALSISWQPSIISLSYTVLDEQHLQFSLPGQSGLVDGGLLLVWVEDGLQVTTLTLTVNVVAEQLLTLLSSSVVTAASTFVLSVAGFDAHGNQDIDYQLSSSATLTIDLPSASVTAVRDLQQGGFALSQLWAPVEGLLHLSVTDGSLSGPPVELELQSTTTQLQLQLGTTASLVAGSSFTVMVMGVDDYAVQDLDFVLSEQLLLQLKPDP